MNPKGEKKNWFVLADLAACITGFGAATLGHRLWFGQAGGQRPEEWIVPWIISAVVAWLAVAFPEGQWNEGVRLAVDGCLAIMGSNLLVQCALNYFFGIRPASWFVIIGGSALSMGLSALLRSRNSGALHSTHNSVLFMGFDTVTAPLAAAMQGRVLGGIERPQAAAPVGVELLGGPDGLAEVCATKRPHSIILGAGQAGASLRQLLEMHYAGMEMEGSSYLCESVLERIAWQQMHPADLLFFLNPTVSPAMLAFQSVYKNLLGLALRIIFAPLMIVTSLLIILFTKGPALERIECLGFQRIPFQMLRFRIYRSDGTLSWIGGVISRLHITNLPQLINVVRGEMSLFGPAPVRTTLAHRMSELMPAYDYRFTVKPGIFGWSSANVNSRGGIPDEGLLLELDLYYVKQESPSLDLDILLRMMFRSASKERRPRALAAAGH
jgi:lipopolysaccharide/colanic/teichoic acid biosynthesis glycosyltransferase